MSNPIVVSECVVHDAKEAKRYQQMGLSDEPPKKRVSFAFHLGDIKTLTRHYLDEDDETELDELTVVKFHDGNSVPLTEPFEDISQRFSDYHNELEQSYE